MKNGLLTAIRYFLLIYSVSKLFTVPSSDVNKDLTFKDKDQTLNAKDLDKDHTYKDQTPKDMDQTFKDKD